MKDRRIPCIYYTCAGADCEKGFKEVTMEKCKNCQKYHPRKLSKRPEPVKLKRYKDADRHAGY